MQKRGYFKIYMMLWLIGLFMVGCSHTNEEITRDKSRQTQPSITVMASQNWIKEVDRQLFKEFEKETNIRVKLLVTPDNGYDTLLGTTLADGSNSVDIFMSLGGSSMVRAGIPKVAYDLSDQAWVHQLEPWAKEANTYENKLLGFSTWGQDYEGVLYNKTYFAEHDLEIPQSWNEFIELCDKISDMGVVPFYEGINGNWHTESLVYAMTPVLLKEYPNMIQKLNTSVTTGFSDFPKFKEGLEQIADFLSVKKDGIAKYYSNNGQAEDWFGSYDALKNRENVMMFTYSAYSAELKEMGSMDEWGMFPFPVLDNQTVISNGGGISKYINKNSGKIQESLMLLEFLSRGENLEKYYAGRPDLVTSSFKAVSSVMPTLATKEAKERSKDTIPIYMSNEIMYWDADMYLYLQGLAEQTLTVEQCIDNIDTFRRNMFAAME